MERERGDTEANVPMGMQANNTLQQPIWNPYGFYQFGSAPDGNHTAPMMNPLLSPMMFRGSAPVGGSPYGPLLQQPQQQFTPNGEQQMMIMEQFPTMRGDPAQGYQPMVYPMVMMVPMDQRMSQMSGNFVGLSPNQYPDLVGNSRTQEDQAVPGEDSQADSDGDPGVRADHDVTPDLVRETEPTYMNEGMDNQGDCMSDHPDGSNQSEIIQPSYVNSNSQQNRRTRSFSVEPGQLRGKQHLLNRRREKYSTYHADTSRARSSMANREGETTSTATRSFALSRTFSTASHASFRSTISGHPLAAGRDPGGGFSPSFRPGTVLHIPDIKPNSGKEKAEAFAAASRASASGPTSFMPSNLRTMRHKLGRSLVSFKNALLGGTATGGGGAGSSAAGTPGSVSKMGNTPRLSVIGRSGTALTSEGVGSPGVGSKLGPSTPYRPPRRKYQDLAMSVVEDTISEELSTGTPVNSPNNAANRQSSKPRYSNVDYPTEVGVEMKEEDDPSAGGLRVPVVPMPGGGSLSTTPTFNALEMIGSPITGRSKSLTDAGVAAGQTEALTPATPRVKMPTGGDDHQTSGGVQLRENPGRRILAGQPTVPQPKGSNKIHRRSFKSNRMSDQTASMGSQFHSVISSLSTASCDLFPLEDLAAVGNSCKVMGLDSQVMDKEALQAGNSLQAEQMFSVFSLRSSEDGGSQESGQNSKEGKDEGDKAYDPVPFPRPTGSESLAVHRSPDLEAMSEVTAEEDLGVSEAREDILQGIRAMDDSIKTLKAEMTKLLSVYETVRLQPEEVATPVAITIDQDKVDVVEETVVSVTLPTPQSNDKKDNASETSGALYLDETGSQNKMASSVQESVYNLDLGVYHENEMSNQRVLSPLPPQQSASGKQNFRKAKQARRQSGLRSQSQAKQEEDDKQQEFRRSFLGLDTLDALTNADDQDQEGAAEAQGHDQPASAANIGQSKDYEDDDDGGYSDVDLGDGDDNVSEAGQGKLMSHQNKAKRVNQPEAGSDCESGSETLDVTMDVETGHDQTDIPHDSDHEENVEEDEIQPEEEDDIEQEEVDVISTRGNMTIRDFLEETKTIATNENDEAFNELMGKSAVTTWEDLTLRSLDGRTDLPPPLLLQENLRSLKLDLLSSIFQGLYPTEGDCQMVRLFISCPATLEEKYVMMRFADILKRNKKDGVTLETLCLAMSQLARIGQELMKNELERDPVWRSVPCAKEIMVQKGITERAPWELIQGGTEILESLGYTQYTGFALQYPRNIIPDMFADHIGNLTVELVLAASEVNSLIMREQPTLQTLQTLMEVEPFPGMDPQSYYPEVPLLEDAGAGEDKEQQSQPPAVPRPRANSALSDWIKKPSPKEGDDQSVISVEKDNQPTKMKHSRQNESEYEEIGPPKHRNGMVPSQSHFVERARESPAEESIPCDLCGSPNAMVSCSACQQQMFCAACDEMYHKHPKRSEHVRKSLHSRGATAGTLPSSRPAVEMPGPGPKAPPRRHGRKDRVTNSVEPSPRVSDSRQATLNRKSSMNAGHLSDQQGHPMAGRPLPPPPPVPVLQAGKPSPPPILPKKSASLVQMVSMASNSRQNNYPTHLVPKSIPMPGSTNMDLHNGGKSGVYPMTNMAGHRMSGYSSAANPAVYPPGSGYPAGGGGTLQRGSSGYRSGWIGADGGLPSTAASEVGRTGSRRSQTGRSGKDRFAHKVNRSSSLHDLARARVDPNAADLNSGIKWRDESHKYTGVANNFQRTTSTKSLHTLGTSGVGNLWQNNGMAGNIPPNAHNSNVWTGQLFANGGQISTAIIPGWGPVGVMGPPGSGPPPTSTNGGAGPLPLGGLNLNRSLHELSAAGLTPQQQQQAAAYMLSGGGLPQQQVAANQGYNRPISPSQSSVKSKKSIRSNLSANSRGRHDHSHAAAGRQSNRRLGGGGGGGRETTSRHRQKHRSTSSSQPRRHNHRRHGRRTTDESSSRSRNQSRNSHHKRLSRHKYDAHPDEDDSESDVSSDDRDRRRHSQSDDDEDDDDISRTRDDKTESSDNFYTGDSDSQSQSQSHSSEFVSVSSNSDKLLSRLSWTCEHCTFVNAPGTKVCSVCCKTSRLSREITNGGDSKKGRKSSVTPNTSRRRKNKQSANDDSDQDVRDNSRRQQMSSSIRKKSSDVGKNHSASAKVEKKSGKESGGKNKSSASDDRKESKKKKSNSSGGSKRRGKRSDRRRHSDDDEDDEEADSDEDDRQEEDRSRNEDEDDIDDEAIAAYYAVRVEKNKIYADSSSESASAHNPMNTPNLEAPAPAKGILKKAVSNPMLAGAGAQKLGGHSANGGGDMEDSLHGPGAAMSEAGGTVSELGYITNKLTERLRARGAAIDMSPPVNQSNNQEAPEDNWLRDRELAWQRQKEELKAWARDQARDDPVPSSTNGMWNREEVPPPANSNTNGHWNREEPPWAREEPANQKEMMFMRGDNYGGTNLHRTFSGHSLAEQDLLGFQPMHRRGSEQPTTLASGKRNFRSKRFSRNLERDVSVGPTLKRAQSFNMDPRMEHDLWMDQNRRFYRATSKNSVTSEQPLEWGYPHSGHPNQHNMSDNSDVEDPGLMHFTSTVTTSSSRGPGGIGSYLSRREFGSNETANNQQAPDSGYVSHGSAGGYPKLQMQSNPINSMKSFTMSVDRGFLGGPSKPSLIPSTPNLEFNRYRSMDDLGGAGQKEMMKPSGQELVKLLREAEKSGFTSEDIQVAVNHCGEMNPVDWLHENWNNMIETVMTLASNVGHEATENTIGTISKTEAKAALRDHKGNIWAAVTECVEARQKKYDELMAKGNFVREDAVTMLTAHEGNVEAAFQELNKAQLKPFLLRLWGQNTAENGQGAAADNGQNGQKEAEPVDAAEQEGQPEPVKDQENEEEEVFEKPAEEPAQPEKQAVSPQQLAFERQVRRLLAEGKVNSFPIGEVVIRLIDAGYPEDEALLATAQLGPEPGDDIEANLESAMLLLNRECELCATQMNIKTVVRMVNCPHSCCTNCAINFFSVVIKDQNISQAVCPFCSEPKNLAEDDDVALAYYANLDILLKAILDKDVHDLFQRKLRDRTLMKDPNFKWCYKCPFGFLADPKNKKLVCPDCRAMACAKCQLPWEAQHEGISCADFARWKEENDPDRQAKGLEEHMAEHGISCPACKFRYTLTRGGCMHFTCSQCKFEFCIGCQKPFKMGTKCGRDPTCAKMGLHAHHPRNCLFYLRDKEPTDLQKLLKKNKVDYAKEPPEGSEAQGCRVQVQKEGSDGMIDGPCGEEVGKGYGGYCRVHYVEYLCGLIVNHKLEVVSLFELGEVKAVFTRANKFIPSQRPGEYEFQYLRRLAQVVEQEIPLDSA